MSKHLRVINPWFFIPFLIWVVGGGVALFVFDTRQLFGFFNGHHSTLSDTLMFYITFMGDGLFTALVLLLLLGLDRLRNWWYFLTAVLTNVVPAVFIQLVKSGVSAPRPLKFFNNAEWIHILPEWPRLMERSFPSGHSTSAFCLFGLLSMLLPAKYRPLGLIFFICACLVMYSRMYLAAHFFLDVYVGSIIATVFTTVIFAIMSTYKQRLMSRG